MRVATARRHSGLELRMTPMIDVVFLLLVFFLWTSSFNEPEFDLPSSVAAEQTAAAEARGQQTNQPEAFDEIIILVSPLDSPNPLQLNGQPVQSLQILRDQLSEIAGLSADPSVIVDPTETTEIGRAVAVYDIARSAGFKKVLFAAK